ncbi:GNAT family protein [Brachybacterium paraconglomeratum]|uniref:GNAT family N-acetyltransferase n=1 Tax=Brachybacterium paraconglomeratum TaxID=173362 RepID=UPI0031F0BAD9
MPDCSAPDCSAPDSSAPATSAPDASAPATPAPHPRSPAQRPPVFPHQVTLTLLAVEDAPVLAELETRNREQLMAGAPARAEGWFTEAGQRTAIAHAVADREAGGGLPFTIRLEDKGATRIVGRLNLSTIIRGAFESASLGYWVDTDVTGRGVATHAVQSAIAVAFGGLGLHRLQAEVKVGNEASVRVLEYCGFTEYGLAKDYLRLGGDWADCRLFQLIEPHWQPTAPGSA